MEGERRYKLLFAHRLCAWEGQEVQFSHVTYFVVDYKKEEEKVV